MALPAIFVEIGAKIDGFERAMGDVSKQLDSVDRQASKAFSGFEKLGGRLVDLGSYITAGVTLPIAGAAAAATKFAVDFELGMRQVTTLIGGATQKDFADLSAAVLKLSKDVGIDAVKATNALYEAISAGVPKENAIDFLRVASVAAIAGLTETNIAVDALTTIIAAYGLEVKDARAVSDAMFQAVNVGKTTFAQLAAAIGPAAQQASNLGISYQELLAATATLSVTSGGVGVAVTQIESAMRALLDPTKQMEAALKAVGFQTGSAAVQTLGFEGTLQKLREGTHGSAEAFNALFGRIEGANGALGLTGPKAAVAARDLETLRHASDGVGESQKALDKINLSTTRQFERFSAELKVTAIEMGTALLPALNSLLQSSKPLIDALASAVKWFTELSPGVQTAAIALAAGTAAIGPLLLAMGGMVSAVTTIIPAITSLAGAIGVAGGVGLSGAFAVAGPLAIAFGIAIAGWAIYEAITEIGKLDAEIQRLQETLAKGKVASEEQADAIKALEYAIGQHNKTIGKQRVEVDATGKSVEEYLGALKKAAKENNIATESFDTGLKIITKVAAAHKTGTATVKSHGKEISAFATAVEKEVKALLEAEQKAKVHEAALKRLGRESETSKKRAEENARAYDQWKESGNRLEQSTADLALTLGKAHEKMRAETLKTVEIVVPLSERIPKPIQDAVKANDDLVAAYKRLGIASTSELRKIADQHYRDFETIKNSGRAAAGDLGEAFQSWARAAIAAAKQAGEEIPPEIEALSGDIKEKTDKGLTATQERWKNFSASVSTVITNFAQDISRSLWDGSMSWGEKGMKLLKDLGQATTSLFIEPATKALSDFVTGALSDLIGGKGFGGIFARVKDIGDTITGIFSAGGSSAASTAANAGGAAASAGGGVASTAGSAASAAAGSVTQLVTAISSVATAVSSIISNFQLAGVNKSLDLIEKATRYSESHLLTIVDKGVNMFLAELPSIHALQVQFLDQHAWRIHDVWDRLGTLIDVVRMETNPILSRMDAALAGGEGREVHLHFYGAQDRSTIDYAVQQVSRNLR